MAASQRSTQNHQAIAGVALLIAASFLAISLLSYQPGDPSWNSFSEADGPILNWGGLFGSYLADGLLQLFGLVSFALILILGFLGWQRLNLGGGSESKHVILDANILKTISAVALALISCTGLLSLSGWQIFSGFSAGGLVGHLTSRFFTMAFSEIGSALLFVGGLWASAVLMSTKAANLPGILSNLKQKLKERLPDFQLTEHFQKFRDRLKSLFRKEHAELKQSLEKNRFEWPMLKAKKEHSPSEDETYPVKNAINTNEAEEDEQEDEDEQSNFPLFSFSKPKAEKLAGERDLLIETKPRKRRRSPEDFDFPSIQLLDQAPPESTGVSRDELIENSKTLEQKLYDFGIQGQVKDIKPGPIITLYEFEPAPGVKVKNILNLSDDLKLAMKAVSIRIVAPIPGKAAVGIEIPNKRRQIVALREIIESRLFENSGSPLTIAMGKSTGGDAFVADLAKMPHLLIAGATGSGKSVGLNAMIVSTLFKASPEELKFIMIDPKMLELSVYEGIPHLLLPVVTDPKKASRALAWAVKEMERRYKLISSLGARNLKSYNEKVERLSVEELEKEIEMAAAEEEATSNLLADEEDQSKKQRELFLEEMGMDSYVKLPLLCIVIDELADLMMVAGREVEESIARLAQMARAAGIHLILATQRPSVDVITGVIKANFPTRVAYQVASKVDSRTILDGPGAENLIGDGDLLFLPPGTSRLERLHGPFVSEDEIDRVVKHLKTQATAEYDERIVLEEQANSTSDGEFSDIDDELYDQALQVVFESQSPSASMIQRRLRVGYNRAARLIERMESEGIVSAPMGSGKGRELLINPSADHGRA